MEEDSKNGHENAEISENGDDTPIITPLVVKAKFTFKPVNNDEVFALLGPLLFRFSAFFCHFNFSYHFARIA